MDVILNDALTDMVEYHLNVFLLAEFSVVNGCTGNWIADLWNVKLSFDSN